MKTSECVGQLKDGKFAQFWCFFKIEAIIYANIKFYLLIAEFNVFTETLNVSNFFCYEISTLGQLDLCAAENFWNKAIICPTSSGMKVSIVRQGIEHN